MTGTLQTIGIKTISPADATLADIAPDDPGLAHAVESALA